MGSSTDDRSIGMPAAQDAGWPVDLLRSIWSEQRELLAERVDAIDHATAALEGGRLDEQLRVQAQRAAHTLSGSIGIFGFHQASEAARELELELESPALERVPTIRKLLSCLHRIDRGPPESRG
jgi:chemotaxis protein histidine kinase CheA